MLNLGDCKHVGVYHEKRVAATYPIRIRVAVERNGKFRFSYSFPQLPQKIFSYNSESGTYAGKTSLESLPSVENRKTIKTLPSQFVVRKLLQLYITHKKSIRNYNLILKKCTRNECNMSFRGSFRKGTTSVWLDCQNSKGSSFLRTSNKAERKPQELPLKPSNSLSSTSWTLDGGGSPSTSPDSSILSSGQLPKLR